MDYGFIQFLITLVLAVGGTSATYYTSQNKLQKEIHEIHLILIKKESEVNNLINEQLEKVYSKLDKLSHEVNKENSSFSFSDEKIIMRIDSLEKEIKNYYVNTDNTIKQVENKFDKQMDFLMKEYISLKHYINNRITDSRYTTRTEDLLELSKAIDITNYDFSEIQRLKKSDNTSNT